MIIIYCVDKLVVGRKVNKGGDKKGEAKNGKNDRILY